MKKLNWNEHTVVTCSKIIPNCNDVFKTKTTLNVSALKFLYYGSEIETFFSRRPLAMFFGFG